MVAWLVGGAGDPARIHHEGQAARVAIEQAREQVAALLGARGREVVFTSGATEAIADAVFGATADRGHVVASAVEHSAVRLSSARHDLTLVGCDRLGRIDPAALLDAVRSDTAVVHVQWGNHEVGTTQPVAEVVEGCRERGVLVHVDAAQAAGHVPIDFRATGADLMSVSAHKMGGPPGVGALVVRRGLRLDPLLVGGDQERARRAGFENVPAIVGWGAAAATLAARREENRRADEPEQHGREENRRADEPEQHGREENRRADEPEQHGREENRRAEEPGVHALDEEEQRARAQTARVLAAAGSLEGIDVYGDPVGRLPHLVCLGVRGIEPQAVLLGLDQAGIAVHSGSACASEDLAPSPVLEAMGVDAHHSLRISVGWSTTDDDIDALLEALPPVLTRLRALAH
jgi:cysteine desulfurase